MVAEHAGQVGLLVWNVGVTCLRLRVSRRETLRQVYAVGIQSILIVLVAAVIVLLPWSAAAAAAAVVVVAAQGANSPGCEKPWCSGT